MSPEIRFGYNNLNGWMILPNPFNKWHGIKFLEFGNCKIAMQVCDVGPIIGRQFFKDQQVHSRDLPFCKFISLFLEYFPEICLFHSKKNGLVAWELSRPNNQPKPKILFNTLHVITCARIYFYSISLIDE